jgi:hypothetical protein
LLRLDRCCGAALRAEPKAFFYLSGDATGLLAIYSATNS